MLQLDAEALYAELLGGVRSLLKPDGVLVGVDYDKLKAQAIASRDHIVSEMPEAQLGGNWHPDLG